MMKGLTRSTLALGVAGVTLAGYAWQVETRWLRVRRLTLTLPGLPPAFAGYRIVHLSDLHLGVRQSEQNFPNITAAARREQADLIVVTGDFATASSRGWYNNKPALARFAAPGAARDGIWAVLGNHDHHFGALKVAATLREVGIGLLVNSHHTLRRGEDRLILAGIMDMVYGLPDLDRALEGAPAHTPVILLAHEPDFASIAARDGRIALQLSGHTHGGQIRLPGVRPLVLPTFGRAYPSGVYQVGKMALYVTPGVGTGHFAFRFNCRPEIVVITLACGPENQPAEWTSP